MATEVRIWPVLVGGERVETADTLAVTSPWDGETVAEVAVAGRDEAVRAVDAAAQATAEGLPASERAAILDRAADGIADRMDELVNLLALEIGKPVSAGKVEVARCVETLRFSAVAARTLTGRTVPMDAHHAGSRHFGFTLRIPVGVVGAIAPFNFPLNLAAHKVGPAIAAGCGAVLKPASKSPLSDLILGEVLVEAGLPPGWLSVLVGPADEIADVLVSDARVGMITFTGSSEVGWRLRERAPRKRVSLELGNSTPLIVCADADLEAAAQAAAKSGFGFAGQSCISVQRVLVEEPAVEEVAGRLAELADGIAVGDPTDPDTVVGPLIDGSARDRVLAEVEAAVDGGARRLAGGRDENGLVRPTVLADVPPDADAWAREIFGPVVCVAPFHSLDDAIELANGTEYGLQAGIYTSDVDRALTAARRLDFGGVTVNETPTFRVDQMPYGGVKESGNTREGPAQTVLEMTEERMVAVGTDAFAAPGR